MSYFIGRNDVSGVAGSQQDKTLRNNLTMWFQKEGAKEQANNSKLPFIPLETNFMFPEYNKDAA